MSAVRRRPTPLRVREPRNDHPVAPGPDGATTGDGAVGQAMTHDVSTRTRTEEDRRSFASAVRALRSGTGFLNLSERTLMVLGGVLAPLGLLLVILGWVGASRTPNLFEQIPYMISGGLLGLGLVFLGAFLYFAHWITELVKESRTQSAALLGAIEALHEEISAGNRNAVVEGASVGAGATPLVATVRGSMVHRPDCVVVADKADLRTVDADEPLMPCKLCEPFEQD